MKTAISIPDDLFKAVEALAEELHLSRSHVFADAVRDYVEKRSNEKILEALNKVYSEVETEQETKLRKLSKERYGRLLKVGKW